jgi:hypothetical protein
MTGTKRQPGGYVNGLPIAPEQTGAYGPHPTAYQQRMRDLLDQGPAVILPPIEAKPIQRTRLHSEKCGLDCIECWNASQLYNEYLKQKRLNEL